MLECVIFAMHIGRCISHELFDQEANSTTDTLSKSVCVLTGHEHNELKYYCCEESCCKTVCANCIVESHKDHETKPVSEEFTKRKKAMENVLQATKEKIKNVKLFLDTIKNNKVLFVQNDEKGRKSLNEQKVRAFKYITDFQEEIVKCADASKVFHRKFNGMLYHYRRSVIREEHECLSIG